MTSLEPKTAAANFGRIILAVFLGIIVLLMVVFPYLKLSTTALVALLAVLFFYFFLKVKFNIKLPIFVLMALMIGVAVDALGNYFGFYNRKFGSLWYDNYTHLIGTAAVALTFFWLIYDLKLKERIKLSLIAVSIFAFGLTIALASFYEVTEFWDEIYFGGKRIWGIHDTSRDLEWDMIGAIVGISISLGILKLRSRKLHNERVP